MPDEIDFYPSTKTLLAVIGKSLFWGWVAGATCFVVIFILSFFIEAIGGNLGPLGGLIGGIIWGLFAFLIGTFLAGLCQIRRVNTLPIWACVGYALFLALFLLPPIAFLLFYL